MSETVIQIEDLSKRYRLGVIGGRRLVDDVNRQWAKLRGKPDPLSKIGQDLKGKNRINGMSDSDEMWALKDVSFEVKRGEVLGIIGRNGAGKSTLLKILSRVTAPTSGEVRVKGRIASLLEVGTGFHPELTGRENVFLNGAILGMTKMEIRKRFDEIVSFAEIEKFADTPVKRYSSGMYVRLAFAVAAHLESEILIVDEVLAVGDAAFQEKCLGKMETVAGEGRTVLLVSHNMSTIQQLCKRAILFRNGQMHRTGPPFEIVSDYLSDSRQGSKIEIKDWLDRQGTGDARLVRLLVSDVIGNELVTFARGSTICFELEAEFYRPFINPCFGIIIHGPTGQPVIDLRSTHDGLRIGNVNGKLSIRATLRNNGLYPGRYFLSPWISESGRDIDFPQMCGTIQILPAPGPYGDLQLDPRWGIYFVPSEWQVEKLLGS